ncbi:MAG: hypothetical protein LUD72_02730 [Bacteroidales bacterium]|nr:hypothetical protein [Bacteroidales bacterium]
MNNSVSVSGTHKLGNKISAFLADERSGAQLYLLAFSIFLCGESLSTTMFSIPGRVYLVIKVVAVVLVAAKMILFDRYRARSFWFMVCLLGVGALIIVSSGYTEAFFWIAMVLGAKSVPFKKILQIYLIISVSIVLLAFCASLLDVIPNLQYGRDVGYVVRNSFGILYTTDFASHIFSIVLVSFYLLKDRLRIYHYIVAIVLATLVYRFCYTRVDVVCIFLLIAVFIGVNLWERGHLLTKRFRTGEKNTRWLRWFMPIVAAIMFVITYLYSTDNRLLYHLDRILSNRLMYGKIGLTRFGITLFGQNAPMEGNGSTVIHLKDYFFVDCSYIYVFIRYGLIFLLIVLAVYVLCCRKMRADYYFLAAIVVISVNCIIAHHLVELAYSPFALALLAAVPEPGGDKKRMLWER